MRNALVAALFFFVVGSPNAEARGRHKKQKPRVSAAQARARAEHQKHVAEQAREEAELAEVRSGRVTEPTREYAPQADDNETPGGLARR